MGGGRGGAGEAAVDLSTTGNRFHFLITHNSAVTANGYNEEKMKLVKETRKIWNDDTVKVTATCIRVPVMRAHDISQEGNYGLDLFVCGDQIRKGAALNAVQIAELLPS